MISLEAVIFDLDGVLTETSKQHFMAWQLLAKELGFELPEELNSRLKGISRIQSLEIVLEAGNMQNRFLPDELKSLAERKNNIYLGLIKGFTRKNLSPGAIELLDSLRQEGIKIALASVSQNAGFLLEAMKIADYFDAIAEPTKVKHGKPAPDIFLLAAEMLKLEPRNCLGVEDAYAGIEAIKAAGMRAVGIGNSEDLPNCTVVVSSLKELDIGFLRELMK